MRTPSVPELLSSQSTATRVFQGGPELRMARRSKLIVWQQPVEPLVPQSRFLQRETRSAEGMIAEKEMLEAWGKSFEHGMRNGLPDP